MPKTLSSIGEFGLIDRIQKWTGVLNQPQVGIGDDTAVLRGTAGKDHLFTTDMLIEGVHFSSRTEPRAIGHKALACSLSDVAAMGGIPRWAVVSLGVSARRDVAFVRAICQGMTRLARRFRVGIVGGDTVKSRKTILSVALWGDVKKGCAVTRSGARKGDVICVTGRLGRSLQNGKHLSFTPRIQASQLLVKYFRPTSMIDISDGLIADLGHILKQSRKGAVLRTQDIPLNNLATLPQALYDGEDYELLFTLSSRDAERLSRKTYSGMRFTPIGVMMSHGYGLKLMDRRGKDIFIKGRGYKHF